MLKSRSRSLTKTTINQVKVNNMSSGKENSTLGINTNMSHRGRKSGKSRSNGKLLLQGKIRHFVKIGHLDTNRLLFQR